jgi:arylsulfatase A-like enzyme
VPVISTDFYPTMLDMAGLPLKPEQHMDGRSMEPLLQGSQQPLHDALYWHYPHYGNQGGSPGSVIREGDYKLILFYEDQHVELYDLSRDLGESHDLAHEKPAKAAELLHKLEHWLVEVGAKRPSRNPDAQKG